jgi:hypothetical protein
MRTKAPRSSPDNNCLIDETFDKMLNQMLRPRGLQSRAKNDAHVENEIYESCRSNPY